MSRDPRIERLALALVKHRITDDNTAVTALLNDLDAGDLRRVLLAQTENTVRMFNDVMRAPMVELATSLGKDVNEVIGTYLGALILNVAEMEGPHDEPA